MRLFGLTLALVLVVSACGSSTEEEVLVLAASSLTDALEVLEEAFEATTAGVDAVLSYGGSSTLREQILGGAPGDVFVSADGANMNQIASRGLLSGEVRVVARNRLRIAVPAGNPAGVSGLDDFADEDLLIGLCAEGVPCGDLGRRVLGLADVDPAIDTNEPNVRSLLTKLEAGELDAGIVYATDVDSADGRVQGIDFPESVEVVAEYPIAILADAPEPEGAEAFVNFVLSHEGQEILRRHGFLAP